MAIRHVIGFDNSNLQVIQTLQAQYKERRQIDKNLGIQNTVRFFALQFGGSDVNRASIQYDYEDLTALQQANEKRNADARWNELNQALFEAGFTVTFSGIAFETTPE